MSSGVYDIDLEVKRDRAALGFYCYMLHIRSSFFLVRTLTPKAVGAHLIEYAIIM